jgi:hypothetical protein
MAEILSSGDVPEQPFGDEVELGLRSLIHFANTHSSISRPTEKPTALRDTQGEVVLVDSDGVSLDFTQDDLANSFRRRPRRQ